MSEKVGMKLAHVVGARPNFMKAAPVIRALASKGFSQVLVHTGQHYDLNMSDVFFQNLEIPAPDYNLGVGSGSHAVQTGHMLIEFEKVLLEKRPDLVFVYGDVNSTIAAALVCSKLMIPTAHVEAGLRSFDRTMPEEINRLLTDQIADLLFTPSADGNENLRREGIPEEKIALVGNVMIDTLVRFLPHAKVAGKVNGGNGCEEILKGGRRFGLVTLHRPSNVDDPEKLKSIFNALDDTSLKIPIIFPIHPRTRKRIADCKIRIRSSKLLLTEPLGYIDFLSLQMRAAFVIADSGGIQGETTYIGTRV